MTGEILLPNMYQQAHTQCLIIFKRKSCCQLFANKKIKLNLKEKTRWLLVSYMMMLSLMLGGGVSYEQIKIKDYALTMMYVLTWGSHTQLSDIHSREPS